MLTPKVALEDYFTLLYYYSNNFNFFFTHDQTVQYNFVDNSHGRIFSKNINYLRIRKLISRLFFLINLRKKETFSKKIKFFLFDYGIVKYLILQLWILDKIYLRKLLR